MAFFHGVSTTKLPTQLLPPRQVDSALTVAFGCAPIHRLSASQQALAAPGKILLVQSGDDCTTMLGCNPTGDDFSLWGLSEVAYSHFFLFNVGPAVFVNLFDPAKHNTSVTAEVLQITNGAGQLANVDIYPGTLSIDTFIEGTDFIVNYLTGAVTLPTGSSIPTTTTANANYTCAAPQMVTPTDCIGGTDLLTGNVTGLELINNVFPKFRVPPGIIIAPGFSEDVTVAAIMAAKCQNINSVFSCVAFADIPSDGANAVTLYSDTPQYKQDNNLVDPNMYLCWPKASLGGIDMHLSVQAASVTANTDADNNGIPYASPSNKNLQCDAVKASGTEIVLDIDKAKTLNGNGIASGLNFVDGWKLWGNRTACFPDDTDIADNFLAIARMIAWYRNQLVLTWWQRVDWPITRQLVQTIVESEQFHLNGLASAGAILGGRIAFLETQNNILDLMNGKINFSLSIGFASPAEWIHFDLQYDPTYLQTLFA